MYKSATAFMMTLLLVTGIAFADYNKDKSKKDGSHKADKTKTVVEKAASIDKFSTLVAAIQAADLAEALSGEGPFTVFAPTNKAFEALPEGTLESLLKPENKTKLQQILLYHVVPGNVAAADVVKLDAADTLLAGQSIKIKVKDGKVKLDKNTTVIKTDVKASNGMIHVIDRVLLPKSE